MKKQMTINMEVGNDNGNSEHDLVIDGEIIKQPNVYARTRKLPMLDEVNPEYVAENIHDNLIVTINSNLVRPSIYFIGEYAIKSGKTLKNIKVGVDNSKVESDVLLVNTLGRIAGAGIKKLHEADPELESDIEIHVDMTTALPVTQYSKQNADILANKFMDGSHNVTVHVGTKRVDVKVVFDFVKVLPESVPVIFALQSLTQKKIDSIKDDNFKAIKQNLFDGIFNDFKEDYKKDIDGSYFKKKKILHIAIGEGTTEYPLTEDIVFNPNFIAGSNNGVGHAIEKALPEFKTEAKLRTFSRQNYSALLKNDEHKNHDIAKEIVEEYVEDEADEIIEIAEKEVEKANNDVDIICVHGGGSILMKDFLHKELKSYADSIGTELFYIPKDFAVIMEALGMYEFTKGTIFKKLKERNENKKVS